MTYEVLRGFTANGRIYRAGDRIEGAELKHEASMATRRLIKLVSQAEAHAQGGPPAGTQTVPTAQPDRSAMQTASAPDRTRGRS